jgi:sulfide dehydrogenase cytochrome subunit
MKHLIVRSTSIIALSVMFNVLIPLESSATELGKLTESCNDCHGKDGISTDPDVPIIGGFSAQYLMDSMAAYIDEDRPCPEAEYLGGPNKGEKTDMCKIAEDLSEDDNEAIAEHYAGKPFVPAKQEFDAALVEKGEAVHDELCEKCHSDGGSLASDDAGILAGQWIPYQEITYKDYASGDRAQPKKMKKKMKKLDDETTKQLIHYYASKQ